MSSAWGQFTPAQPPAGKLAGRTRTNPQPIIDPFAALIQPSEEATTLLRRAAEGIDRKDWKLAIDSLQRIVELPGEHVLTSDGRLYESARRHAHRQIASLPAEGLAAYRLVHDGEAVALLKQGLQDHNSELLATVVDRFLCTTPGDEAAFTLADWLIDEGRFAEASGILQSTFGTTGRGGIFPDSHLPTWAVPSRLAICAASLGQKQRAAALLKVASSQPASAAASEPADRHIARWSQRKVAVETCVNQATASESLQRSDWICAMGNPARDARQPEVSPTLRDHEPGMFKLSGEPKFPDAVDDYARNNHLLPVRQLVTNGEVLLLRREDDLLALDIDSFSPRWQTRARREEASAAAEGTDFQGFGQAADNNRQSIEAQLRSDPAVIKGLHDWVGGSVSLARGMALAVEWVGDPPALLPPNIPRRFAPAMVGQSPITHPNRLVAYSLKDGAFLWKSDASETKQVSINGTGPAETEFLAPPIYVEPNPAASASNASSARGRDGYLVAPCRMNGDLFAALLEPSTGKMVRQIYLCGTGAGAFDSLETREPCLADGVIYFATGRGLLIAVTTSDWSVRWAVRYPGLPENMVTGGWLPMPPVAVSDVVLLAPSDSDLLLCFDRSSGALRWQSPRGTSTQLVAANESNVWVAGKGVSMLDLESGKPVWNRGTSDISGRVSLSGDRLYVPTFESLVALEARSGEPIMLDDAAEAPGLGNLLAWEGSLYSVGAFKVKKYPDLGKGYEQALARHKEKPADPSRALRLAALELLRHKPARAIDALRGLPDI